VTAPGASAASGGPGLPDTHIDDGFDVAGVRIVPETHETGGRVAIRADFVRLAHEARR